MTTHYPQPATSSSTAASSSSSSSSSSSLSPSSQPPLRLPPSGNLPNSTMLHDRRASTPSHSQLPSGSNHQYRDIARSHRNLEIRDGSSAATSRTGSPAGSPALHQSSSHLAAPAVNGDEALHEAHGSEKRLGKGLLHFNRSSPSLPLEPSANHRDPRNHVIKKRSSFFTLIKSRTGAKQQHPQEQSEGQQNPDQLLKAARADEVGQSSKFAASSDPALPKLTLASRDQSGTRLVKKPSQQRSLAMAEGIPESGPDASRTSARKGSVHRLDETAFPIQSLRQMDFGSLNSEQAQPIGEKFARSSSPQGHSPTTQVPLGPLQTIVSTPSDTPYPPSSSSISAAPSSSADSAQIEDFPAAPPQIPLQLSPSASSGSQRSLREIRKAVESKQEVMTEGLAEPLTRSASAHRSFSAGSRLRPDGTIQSTMTPRAALTSSPVNANAADEDDDGFATGLPAAVPAARSLSMMDFLNGDSPSQRVGASSSANPTPSHSTALATAGIEDTKSMPASSSNGLLRNRQRPKSMMVHSPTKASASDAEGLSNSPRHVRRRRSGDFAKSAETTSSSGNATPPEPSNIHTVDGSNAGQAPAGKARATHHEDRLELTVRPVHDVVTMFGSTQTSANYSVSGKIEVTLPRPRPPQSKSRSPANDLSEASSTVTSLEAPALVKSLTVTFAGYSVYADLSGRYSGVKLCEIKQDLLTAGAQLPLQSDLQASGLNESSNEPLKYEIQFDLNIPGWLPGSAYSRFGSTFYALGASAVVEGGKLWSSSKTLESGFPSADSVDVARLAHALGYASPTLTGITRTPSPLGGREMPLPHDSTRFGLFGEVNLIAGEFGMLPEDPVELGRAATTKGKAKSSWLGKRAKQLSLKPRNSIAQASTQRSASVSGPSSRRNSARPPLLTRRECGGKHRQSDGTILVKSDRQLIIIRRCRDVIPVPVARMAIVGEGVLVDPQNPSLQPNSLTSRAAPPPDTAMATEPAATMSDEAASPLPQAARQGATIQGVPDAPSATIPADAGVTEPTKPVVPTLPTDATTDALPIAEPALPPQPLSTAATNLQAPADRAKHSPTTPVRTSSAFNGTPTQTPVDGMSGSREDNNSPALRHFLHRPILHPPIDSGIEDQEGLPFGLTISIPSHIQVQTAQTLSFGITVEVPRTADWAKVKQLGGLRLRDMELICLQTERHTSVPSRTFCAVFPLPIEHKVAAVDLPVMPEFSPPMNDRLLSSSQEVRVRAAYDPEPIVTHLSMLEAGKTLPPEENDVERVRTTIVGPPPQTKHRQQGREQDASGKGKDRDRKSMPSRANTASKQNLLPEQASAARPSSPGSNIGPSLVPPPGTSSGNSLSPISSPSRRRSLLLPLSTSVDNDVGSQASANASSPLTAASGQVSSAPSPVEHVSDSLTPVESNVEGIATDAPRRGGRGRRAYEATMRGLSAFATAMMETGYEDVPNGQVTGGAQETMTEQEQLRATYHFNGEDGYGVDLTRGHIRMTVNLPLTTASATAARRQGTPQLLPDYESPHTRVRHKLKVKLGFGFGAKPLGGEGEWGQALVMCVPVRFTDAPPREVKEQFAPMPITVTTADSSDGSAILRPTISVNNSVSSTVPVLPAYTQLFRDDGSRLNEAEDLPAYPGPRAKRLSRPGVSQMPSSLGNVAAALLGRPSLGSRKSSQVGVSANAGMSACASSVASGSTSVDGSATPTAPASPSRAAFVQGSSTSARPSLPQRGSVTGPLHHYNREPQVASTSSAGSPSMSPNPSSSTHAVPLSHDNSLAPSRIVDDALGAITDPDQSLAEMRDQEREVREWEEEVGEVIEVSTSASASASASATASASAPASASTLISRQPVDGPNQGQMDMDTEMDQSIRRMAELEDEVGF